MFIVRCRDVDVVSHGESINETLADLEEALSLYFEGEELHLVTVLDEFDMTAAMRPEAPVTKTRVRTPLRAFSRPT